MRVIRLLALALLALAAPLSPWACIAFASDYLSRASATPQQPGLPDNEKMPDRDMLDTSQHILLLYPAFDLSSRARAERVLSLKRIARERLTDCAGSSPAAPPELASLVSRWDQLPPRLTLPQLEQQPDLEQAITQLVWDTESLTAQVCGTPTGDDALLLRMTQNPAAVEQE